MAKQAKKIPAKKIEARIVRSGFVNEVTGLEYSTYKLRVASSNKWFHTSEEYATASNAKRSAKRYAKKNNMQISWIK